MYVLNAILYHVYGGVCSVIDCADVMKNVCNFFFSKLVNIYIYNGKSVSV